MLGMEEKACRAANFVAEEAKAVRPPKRDNRIRLLLSKPRAGRTDPSV